MTEHERGRGRAASPAAAGEPAARLRGRDIVCVGFNDWETELWTNQHHLMSRLAQENRVLFVESLGLRRPTLAGRDVRRIVRRVRTGLAGVREVAVRGGVLHVVSPLVLPFHGSGLVRGVNRVLLRRAVGRAAREVGLREVILWAYVPQAQALAATLGPALTVYHCVDDVAAHERIDTAGFRAAERVFVAQADLVIASAPLIAERLRAQSEHVELLANVADTELFAGALGAGAVDAQLAELAAPRLLFTGAIAGVKLDFELLVGLARARREWSVVLVGPVGLGDPHTDVSRLQAEPNIHLLGARRYDELPALLRGADVGLIPYARNELTASVFPMKVYEYLAAGLPVLATPLGALAGVDDVEFAAEAGVAVKVLEQMLERDSPAARAERSGRARGHSWESRLTEIAELVAQAERRGAGGRAARGSRAPAEQGPSAPAEQGPSAPAEQGPSAPGAPGERA